MNVILNSPVLRSRTVLITVLFTFLWCHGFAQPLSGTFTVGSGGTYPTITEAVADVTAKGVSGPVVFRLKTGTFTEQVTIGAITGTSATNTITFEAESGNAQDVVISFAPTVANNYVIRLDNARFLAFRNFSVETSGTTYTRAIHAINSLNAITFEGLRITLPSTTSATEELGAIIARSSLSSNIRFINNIITGGSHGILHIGNGSSHSPGVVFTGNTITNVHARPVYLQNIDGLIFNDNVITHTGASYSDYYGASIQNTSGYLEMLRNRITGAVGHALYLSYCSGIESQPSIIANNFLHSNSNYATMHVFRGLSHTNIYHNSMHNTSSGAVLDFDRYQSLGNRIVNNIFKGNTGYAMYFQNSGLAVNSIIESDYNNLFTSGSFIARDGSPTYGTVDQWEGASGFEVHSVSYDPQYQSNTALYASGPGIASAGKNLLSVVDSDIDGVARTGTPSLGATQFSAAALTPLSGTYTIGTGAFDFTSISTAIDAMKLNGINGPVTFLLNSQIFAERFILPSVSGVSAANRITFQSQSGNPDDVILTPAAATDAARN